MTNKTNQMMRALCISITITCLILPLARADQGFELIGPNVSKIGWNTRSLIAFDVDNDGRIDLAVINNDRARIEILYQHTPGDKIEVAQRPNQDRWDPTLEDSAFDKRNISTGLQMYALAVGDLNRDGRPDLVYTGTPDDLTILYQDASGRFGNKRVFDVGDPVTYIASVLIADIDDDGHNELAMLTQEKLLVFEYDNGRVERQRSYALSSDNCDALMVFDANGDGRTDISYQVPQEQDRLRVRLGSRAGTFGPEYLFRLDEVGGTLQPIRVKGTTQPDFVRVQWNTGLIEILTLKAQKKGDTLLKNVRPRIFSAETSNSADATYTIADLDGNGFSDLVFADSKNANIRVIMQTAQGVFGEAKEYPALADIRSLASGDLDHDGRYEIIMASPREKTVAIARLTKQGRLSYPTPLPTLGKPWAVAVGDLNGDGIAEIAYAYDEKKDKGAVVLTRSDIKSEFTASRLPVEGLQSGPRGLRIVDCNLDGRPDLAVLAPHEPMKLLINNEGLEFSEANVDDGFREGLVNDVTTTALTLGDITGDGVNEIFVASKGYARALKVSQSGTLEVIDQYNARSSDSVVAAAVVTDLDGDSTPEIVLVLDADTNLEVLVKQPDGVYKFAESVPIGSFELVEARVADLDNNGRPDLLLFGANKLLWLPLGAEDLALVSTATFETDLPNVMHRLVGVGDLNNDGVQEIIAIDSRESRILEIITTNDGIDGIEWSSAMHFTIFNVDPHYKGQRGSASEPSEIVIADLNNDAHDDLALLVHDRILVYSAK